MISVINYWNLKIAPVIDSIIAEAKNITQKFAGLDYNFYPEELEIHELNKQIDFAFLALHGRPGEDGTIQRELDQLGIPYNGSGPDSSSTTIDKYATNEILAANGILVAKHEMLWQEEYERDPEAVLQRINESFGYPLIAKPADDGCSSAVKKVDDEETLRKYLKVIFRDNLELNESQASLLNLKLNEEFPIKTGVLIEELISRKDAKHFLEITGGMLSRTDELGKHHYQVFEASEAVAEGGILSLEEKFLAGEGQNITPARYAITPEDNAIISASVKKVLGKTAKIMQVEGYCRIDAFVRIYSPEEVEVVVIEINSLPGLTPATAIFHQAAIDGLRPAEFLEAIMAYGKSRKKQVSA